MNTTSLTAVVPVSTTKKGAIFVVITITNPTEVEQHAGIVGLNGS